MGKYDDAIGGGKLILDVEEVLNEEAAKKVDDKIKKQKAELSKPIELTVKSDAAVKKLESLTKAATKVKEQLQEAMSTGKEFKDLYKIVSQYETLCEQIKKIAPAVDKNNTALKEGNKVLRDTKKLVDQLMGVEKKPRVTKQKTTVKQELVETEQLKDAVKEVAVEREKSAEKTLRTQKQVAAELEKEMKLLKEIEKQQEKNDAARERFKKKQANYGQEVLGVKHPVYDTDLLKGAKKELDAFNEALATRNKYQEKYNALCRMVEKYYVSDYGVSNGMYKDLDQFVELNAAMKELDALFEAGQKTTNKHINGLFDDVIRSLRSEISSVSRLLSSGEISGALVGQDLSREETQLNREMQRLLEERETQLKKINGLREEELSLIKQAGQEERKKAEVKTKYYEIDERAAKTSKQMRSFDDYKEGSATASYKASVDALAEIVEEKKKQHPDKAEKLDQLLDRYAKNLAAYINRDNQIGAQYPSVMISGAGNYNVKKHNKQLASWGKNYQFYEDSVLAIENKIRTLGGGAEVIRGDEEDALEKLESKVEYMKYWHQVMVEVNKYYRKNKTLEGFEGAEPDELERIKKALVEMKRLGMSDVPYPQYALTNDNQNIKRLEGRIAELKRLKTEGGKSDALSEENNIYKLWVDKKDMRIRISFEMGKPDREIVDILKGKAFKWSPKNDAWQRQLTDNAVYATKQLQKSLHEFYGIEDKVQPVNTDKIAQEKQIETQDQLTSSVKAIEDAYDAVCKKVNSLREQLSAAEKEQENLEQHAKLYGYTLSMTARQAGKVRQILEKDSRSDYVVNMLKKGYTPTKTKDGDYGFDRPDLGKNVYTKTTKTEYEYAQYLLNAVSELNVGWEEGLQILASQNGQLDITRQKVSQLTKELSNTERESELAYERMAYAHRGIFGDDNIAAHKKKLAEKAQSQAVQEATLQAEVQTEANKKLTSSYEGLAEAVEEFVAAHAKVRATTGMKDDYWALSEIEEEKRRKVIDFIPQETKAHYDAYASISYLLNRREHQTAVPAEKILKQIEGYIKKADNEIAQSGINKTKELISRLQSTYGDEYDSIFGGVFKQFGTLKTENSELIYNKLIETEKGFIAEAESQVGVSKKTVVQTEIQTEANKKLISSYDELTDAVKRYIDLAKQLKPTSTPEWDAIVSDMDKVYSVSDIKEAVAEIEAAYKNVQNVKSSLKQGTTSYIHTYADGNKHEYDIDNHTLKELEEKLRGYIYIAVGDFGDIITEEFSGKRIRSFVQKQVEKYLSADVADSIVRKDAYAFNAPIKDKMKEIETAIIDSISDSNKTHDVTEVLHELGHRVDDLNRYTISSQTLHMASYMGIRSPEDEIRENAKVIESYEELCKVVERFRELSKGKYIYSKDNPGLSEEDEKLWMELRGRIENTAANGKDIWNINPRDHFADFHDIDEWAALLGIESPKAIQERNAAIEAQVKRLKEILHIATQNERRDFKKNRPVGEDALRQRIDELKALISQLEELRTEASQIDVPTNGPDGALSWSPGIALTFAIGNKKKDLELYNIMLERITGKAETQVDVNQQLTLSYEELNEAVSKYVTSSKQLWKAYDNGENFEDALTERNAAIKKIASFFPDKRIDGGTDASMYFQSMEMSRYYANLGVEATLAEIKSRVELSQEKKKQAMLAQQATSQTEAQVEAEEKLAEAAKKTTKAKKEQKDVAASTPTITTGNNTRVTDDDNDDSNDDERTSILEHNVNDALARLRSALNNKTAFIDLTGVEDVNQLEKQLRDMAQKVVGSELKVDSVIVQDGVARISLYNDALGITAAQLWKIVPAANEAQAAQLELISEMEKYSPRAAEKYSEAQQKKIEAQQKKTEADNRWLIQQLSKLDTSSRQYKHSNKKIDGASLIGEIDGTSLKDSANVTIDDLAKHIKTRIAESMDTLLTDSVKNSIINDLRILENEIKIQQYEQYASTTMTPTEVNEARQQFEYALKALESKAKKNNVFSQIKDTFDSLYNRVTKETVEDYVAKGTDIGKFVDSFRTLKAELNAAIANEGASKKEAQNLQNLLNLQTRLYAAKQKAAELDIKGESETSAGLKARRVVEELQQQYNESVKLLDTEQKRNVATERQAKLEEELSKFKSEQTLKQQEANTNDQINPIKEQYQAILDIVNKINAKSAEITKYQSKDGGSGIFASYITKLQSEKTLLISELKGITDEINNTEFIQGKEFSVPFASFLNGSSAISDFLNDTKTQASLTTEEIEKLIMALQKSQNIDVGSASNVAEQFKSVQETFKRLSALTELDKNNGTYQSLVRIYAQIIQYKNQLSSDPTLWTPEESANLQELISQFTKYGNILAETGEKEKRYFSNKTKYTHDITMDNSKLLMSDETKRLQEARGKLEEAARSFAKESGKGNAFVTGFTQSADGISSLDFSVFDSATNSLRNFRMEMGSVTDGMYVAETTINKSLANVQAAQKQIQSASNLLGVLSSSGVNIDPNSATGQVAKLLQLMQRLQTETMKGDGADQNLLVKLTKDAKLTTAEVEKLYKQMIKMDEAIGNRTAQNGGTIDLNGDKYSQMSQRIQEFASKFPDATLQIGKLNAETGKLPFTLTNVNGKMSTFEAQLSSLNGQVSIQEKGIKQVGTAWTQFSSIVKRAGKMLLTSLVGYNVFYKAISEVRKGIGYVKEIDLAMTELKKVTDETAESYNNFLQSAAGTSSVIGSTISEFVEATANFARLGYTMEESAKMAESAVVYKNVADGLDTVEAATDSIISTMKAFGIESDNTMGIIDRFNEVGNNFAITSAGIGEALQRSASALYAGGNTIDEAIALVTAANSVIQNPEQVGTALKTKLCLYVQKCA